MIKKTDTFKREALHAGCDEQAIEKIVERILKEPLSGVLVVKVSDELPLVGFRERTHKIRRGRGWVEFVTLHFWSGHYFECYLTNLVKGQYYECNWLSAERFAVLQITGREILATQILANA